MANLKKYNLQSRELGVIPVEDKLLEVKAHPQSIKDYIVAMRNNARQWSASTLNRSEVNKTGKKPHQQKGLGRSRQGCLAAPHYKGGGIAFGPRPKFDQHVRINKKERRAAIASLLAEKIREDRVLVLQQGDLKEPQTKILAAFLKGLKLNGKRVLFLGGSFDAMEMPADVVAVRKSVRNLPKVEFAMVPNLNAYDVMLSGHIVLLDAAVNELIETLR